MFQETSKEGKILRDVRKITRLVENTTMPNPMPIKTVDILKVLGDPLVYEMFMKGIEPNRQKKETSKKIFYIRLEKLKATGLIHRKKIGEYELTARGIIVQEAVKLIEKVLEFSEQLNVCDDYHFLQHGSTISEDLIINAIVTDTELKRILLEKRVPS